MATEISTTLGALFKNRRERGRAGLPLLSVTMGNGLIRRDSLERKTDTGLTDEDHLLVRRGDIAYNMMRMWQGAFGLAKEDGLVSPAYVVLEPGMDVDPLFASYLFRTPRMLHLFWAYSYGLTDDRLRLYFKEFARIPVRIPNIEQQRRIGHLLSTWDNQIELLHRRLRAAELLKRGLAQQLMPDRP